MVVVPGIGIVGALAVKLMTTVLDSPKRVLAREAKHTKFAEKIRDDAFKKNMESALKENSS